MLIFLGLYAIDASYVHWLRYLMRCWQYTTVSFLGPWRCIPLWVLVLVTVVGIHIQRRGISGICFHYFSCQMTVVLRYYHMLLLLIWRLLSWLIWIYVSWKYSLLSLISLKSSERGYIFFLRFGSSLLKLISTNLRRFWSTVIVVTVMCIFETVNCFDSSITDL
jgi:hypothetical protein